MTKLKTMITALLIGTSSMATVAAAQPASVGYWSGPRDHRTNTGYGYDRGYDRDRDYDRDYDRDRDRDGDRDIDPGYFRNDHEWAALSEPVSAAGDRQFIHMNGARASEIRFQLEHGDVYIYEIAVELMNGRTQVQQVGRWMSARDDASETLELGGARSIKRVMVYTADGAHASYQILGTT
jgi:hypothetical protein